MTVRSLKNLSGMLDSNAGLAVTSDHFGEFSDLLLTRKTINHCQGPSLFNLFGNQIMRRGMASDLWQMGNTDNLTMKCQIFHLMADFYGRLSADPGIDLIKNEGEDLVRHAQTGLKCQHDP